MVRWLTSLGRTPDELPLGPPELRLIARNFEADNYYSELFTVIGAMVARPIFENPINPVTRLCNFADDRLARMVPTAGAYYRSVVIRGAKKPGLGDAEVGGAAFTASAGYIYTRKIIKHEALVQKVQEPQ